MKAILRQSGPTLMTRIDPSADGCGAPQEIRALVDPWQSLRTTFNSRPMSVVGEIGERAEETSLSRVTVAQIEQAGSDLSRTRQVHNASNS